MFFAFTYRMLLFVKNLTYMKLKTFLFIEILSVKKFPVHFSPGEDHQKGFTLIELMILVGILAILVAIALPQYQGFLIKSKRGEAIITLNAINTAQFSFFAANDQFCPPVGAWYTVDQDATSVKALPSNVNEALGLGPMAKTKMGWNFGTYFSGLDSTGQITKDYRVVIRLQTDSDPFWDAMLIKYQNISFAGEPDGTPLLAADDISDQVHIPYNF